MRKTLSFQLLLAALAGISCVCLNAKTVQAEGANMAVVAAPSSSFTSGDTSVDALNDGDTPRRSRDRSRGAYGNWNRTGTQWVQYDWSKPISTNKIDVYWWADGQGVHLPAACRLLYWDGSEFVPVKNPKGLGVAGDTFNATEFDEVTTDKLRHGDRFKRYQFHRDSRVESVTTPANRRRFLPPSMPELTVLSW